MVRKLHFTTGMILLLFIVSHLAVHIFALWGAKAHGDALKSIQWLYRNPFVEPVLLSALFFQACLGIRLIKDRWKERGQNIWSRIQIYSGIYLIIFMFNHSIAALYTRHIAALDTNFWWVSATLLHPDMKWIFYPYYALAAISIAAHIAAALHFRTGKNGPATALLITGFGLAAIYLLSFGGWLYPVTPPQAHLDKFDEMLSLGG